jgi:hypothetical protein
VITATPVTNRLAGRLRQRRAHPGTCQVDPHWAQVIVETGDRHGNRMPRSWPRDGIRLRS